MIGLRMFLNRILRIYSNFSTCYDGPSQVRRLIGHALNVLAQFSESLIEVVREKGIRDFIDFVRETIIVLLLDSQFVNKRLSDPIQLRLI